jgi:radical SAM superfamily enzyme YgiQ (UPF0313 family)
MPFIRISSMKITLISTSTYPSDQGIRTISSYLKKQDHKTKLIFLTASENYNKLYSKKVLKQLENLCKDSQLIGVSAYASTSKRASQIIKHLKRLKIPIVYGGVHATISPELCIKNSDIVCIGEGEETILELINSLEKNKDITKIKNLWIKKNNKIIKNPLRPLIQDLDKLSYADYDLENHYILEKGKIKKFKEKHLNGQIFFLTGRGCPYSCSYCSNAYFNKLYPRQKPVRWHSVDYIIKCILYLKSKFKTLNYFDIRDDTFSFRPLEQIKEFNKKYKENVKMRFKCLGDPKTIDNEKIKLLVDAGCTDIIIGIQGSENVNLNIYNRKQTDEQVLKAANILNKYKKLAIMYDVITSNPYESPKDVLNLINLLKKIPVPYYLSVNNLVFFTGSELYKKAKQDKIIKTEKDSAAFLNYWDRWKHIKLKRKNEYLNLILNLMRGVVTKKRFGLMPRSLLNLLLKKKLIKFNLKHKQLTYLFGYLIGISDFTRENIIKPLYRSLPVSFKIWYDKVRYRV